MNIGRAVLGAAIFALLVAPAGHAKNNSSKTHPSGKSGIDLKALMRTNRTHIHIQPHKRSTPDGSPGGSSLTDSFVSYAQGHKESRGAANASEQGTKTHWFQFWKGNKSDQQNQQFASSSPSNTDNSR